MLNSTCIEVEVRESSCNCKSSRVRSSAGQKKKKRVYYSIAASMLIVVYRWTEGKYANMVH